MAGHGEESEIYSTCIGKRQLQNLVSDMEWRLFLVGLFSQLYEQIFLENKQVGRTRGSSKSPGKRRHGCGWHRDSAEWKDAGVMVKGGTGPTGSRMRGRRQWKDGLWLRRGIDQRIVRGTSLVPGSMGWAIPLAC